MISHGRVHGWSKQQAFSTLWVEGVTYDVIGSLVHRVQWAPRRSYKATDKSKEPSLITPSSHSCSQQKESHKHGAPHYSSPTSVEGLSRLQHSNVFNIGFRSLSHRRCHRSSHQGYCRRHPRHRRRHHMGTSTPSFPTYILIESSLNSRYLSLSGISW